MQLAREQHYPGRITQQYLIELIERIGYNIEERRNGREGDLANRSSLRNHPALHHNQRIQRSEVDERNANHHVSIGINNRPSSEATFPELYLLAQKRYNLIRSVRRDLIINGVVFAVLLILMLFSVKIDTSFCGQSLKVWLYTYFSIYVLKTA